MGSLTVGVLEVRHGDTGGEFSSLVMVEVLLVSTIAIRYS